MNPTGRSSLRVSDHALVRFIERAGGLDVEALRTALEGSLKRAIDAAAIVGADEFVIRADGLDYLVKAGVVVTITERASVGRVIR